MNTLSNQVQLIGNLGQDPEMKTFDNGNKMCRFSLATNEYYRDSDGEKQQRTDWHTVVAWGAISENVAKVLKKGDKAAVSGKLKSRSYEDQEGNTRYVTEIVAEDFLKLNPKKSATQ